MSLQLIVPIIRLLKIVLNHVYTIVLIILRTLLMPIVTNHITAFLNVQIIILVAPRQDMGFVFLFALH